MIATGRPQLFGVYCNERQFSGDHVVLYLVRQFRREPFRGSMEIAEAAFYAVDDLPETTTGGTRRRIDELLSGSPPAVNW